MAVGFFFCPDFQESKKPPWDYCRFLLGVARGRTAEDNPAGTSGGLQFFWKGVFFELYGTLGTRKRFLRFGAACLLAVLACSASVAMAVEMTPRMLVPVGHTVGIKLFARGVVVVKLSDGGTPARACGLRAGDVIVKCGGSTVTSTEQFQALLQKSDGSTTDLQVQRQGDPVTLTVEPAPNDQGVYCIGAWIRDSMAGIGTVTYYDPESGAFGALGHGVTDTDTAQLLPFASGSVLPSTVKAVKRGQAGAAGELKGSFDLTKDLGTLTANTASGIFGALSPCALTEGDAIPVAESSEVRDGPAVIRSNVEGDCVKDYQVELKRLGEGEERNLLITVTDPELLTTTGGIVQGMSGSPIIQNGKLIGAVTHVLLNDPTKGYGIFIENMLKAA